MSYFAATMQPPPIMHQLDEEAYGTGASHELAHIRYAAARLWQGYRESSALTYREAAIADAFNALAQQWREETRFQSSVTAITAHPAYRAVVALGDEVVPVLLRELRRGQPEMWFEALHEITGEDPVRTDHWGDIRAMADDWLKWGRQQRLIR